MQSRQAETVAFSLLDQFCDHCKSARNIHLQWHSDGQWLTLTLDDSKPGVDDADLQELFEPLFRADRARQRSQDSGSGLGLSIVRSIAQAHGGSVQASHATAGGLRMTVRLPVRAA